ncbi:SDR family NAD(P)-dependent oxidoreductase [Salegentibacter salegens]|uniref:Short-chain dehydrogenase n=1 Tax=Salegentibacter salegens TaxID=143223 RepID=A0A1M7HSK5_9FLAO|nr:SDR family oxidoreductase [Salegentibacter salegens]PRX43192.1 short-subunit dehydrogenase [Salegentibacter salegens]SHM31522.1 Short-chain dehydrogenase [Salegentibacter salegens]
MKHIVITGTSRGMGYEMVKLFAENGHKVLALSRNDKPVSELNLENVTTFSCDISKAEDLEKVSAFVEAKWEKVDILINNAGALINKDFEEISAEEFQKIYSTNVFGVIGLTQKLLPFMKRDSHVVNISTMGGVQGSVKFPGLSAYSSSKAAVITLTELLAEEYKEKGPSFNVLALGAVQTEMLEEAFPGLEVPLSAKEMAEYIANFSLTGHKFYNGKLLQVSNSTP